MWGYLSEFWDEITQVGDYTVAWFQGIGNAVAGAIGGIFEDLTHHFYDIFYLIQWFLDNLGDILAIAFTPLIWIFNFVKGFFVNATSTLEALGIEIEETTLMTDNLQTFFDSVPYFDLLLTGVAGVLGIFVIIFIVKKIISI